MQRRSAGPQGMVFGGIMAGLILLCALVPFLSIFMPVPLVLVYVRYGGRPAAMTAIVAALLTAMFTGLVQAFLLTVPMGILPGLAFGYGFRHKLRPLLIGVMAVVVFVAAWSANYVVTRTLVLGGQDPVAQMVASPEVKKVFDQVFGVFEQTTEQIQPRNEAEAQAKAQNLEQFRKFRADPAALLWFLLPSSLLMGGAVNTWINYMLCRAVLPRFGHDVPAPTPFSRFRLPVWMAWVYALVGVPAVYLTRMMMEGPWWVQIVLNLNTVLQAIFLLYGLAVAYGYFRIRQEMTKLPSVLWAVVPLFLLGLMGPILYGLVGMADVVFDFRGLGHGLLRRPPDETP